MAITPIMDEATIRTLLEGVDAPELVGPLQVVGDGFSPCRDRGAVVVCAGALNVQGQEIAVHVGFKATFPAAPPMICLLVPDNLGCIPHVERDGYVCYVDSEGLLLNWREPASLIEEAIKLTVAVLDDGMAGKNTRDFLDEFEAYWRQNEHLLRCDSYVEPTHEVRQIIMMRKGSAQEGYLYAADDDSAAAAYDAAAQHFTIVNALYVPLEEHSLVLPPPPQSFWSAAELRAIVRRNLSSANLKRLDRFTQKHKREEVVILKLPRQKGGEVLVGVQCLDVEAAHPLNPQGDAGQLMPILLTRKDMTYLLPRGGANTSLTGRRVAVVGCGSVGGQAAVELVRLGVLNLTLVDPQQLATENIFRHVLGKAGVGAPKAMALKDDIMRRFPYATVQACVETVERALEDDGLKPEDHDLIVVAVGDPSLSLFLNQYFYDCSDAPPVLYTWLEAYGIGGHALLTLNKSRTGCFECLCTSPIDEEGMYERASFAAPGQSFSKNLSGCAGMFTPFSSLDSLRTAALAVDLAVKALVGTVQGNPLLSWKGNGDAFVQAGYIPSDRFKLTTEELYAGRYSYRNSRCPVCGNER